MKSNSQSKKLLQSQSQPPPPTAKKKEKQLPVNPLKGFTTRSSGSSNGSDSSEVSHRFFLSHSFSSSSSSSSSSLGGAFPHRPVRPVVTKTPKSAPVLSKPLIRKKPIKLKSTLTDKPIQRSKINAIKLDKGSTFKKQSSVSTREVKLKDQQTTMKVTPLTKLGSNDDEDDSSYRERTPPVQASLSPEMIQCGSAMNLSGSACYAAGHLLSGISDKRKCKPKGLLTVGEKRKIFDDEEESRMIPLPVDASVHWLLLSPCDEEKEDDKEKSDDGFCEFQQIDDESPSPLSDRSTCSDLCNISSGKSRSPMRRISSSLSPNELSRFRRFMDLSSCEDEASPLKEGKASPLSVDTLGSENVIQTPESNSSFDSYLKRDDVGSALESLTTSLQSARLSPSCSSFKFDSMAAASSDSVDLLQFQRGLGDRREEINSKEASDPEGKGRELLVPFSAAESISTDGGGSLICSEDSNWMDCYKN